jgi:hypothetical protein
LPTPTATSARWSRRPRARATARWRRTMSTRPSANGSTRQARRSTTSRIASAANRSTRTRALATGAIATTAPNSADGSAGIRSGNAVGPICTLMSRNSTPQIVDPLGQVQYGYIYPGEDPAQVVRSWQQELAFPSLQEINRRLSNMRINDCERNQYGRIRKSALRACRCAHSLAQFFADPSLVERAAKENQNEYVLSDWYISLKTEGFVEPEWTNEGEALAKIFRSIAIRCGRKNLVFECECECDREGGDEAYAWTRPRIGGAIQLPPAVER